MYSIDEIRRMNSVQAGETPPTRYANIARTVRAALHEKNDDAAEELKHILKRLADMFANDDPRFNRARFYQAGGVGPSAYELTTGRMR